MIGHSSGDGRADNRPPQRRMDAPERDRTDRKPRSDKPLPADGRQLDDYLDKLFSDKWN